MRQRRFSHRGALEQRANQENQAERESPTWWTNSSYPERQGKWGGEESTTIRYLKKARSRLSHFTRLLRAGNLVFPDGTIRPPVRATMAVQGWRWADYTTCASAEALQVWNSLVTKGRHQLPATQPGLEGLEVLWSEETQPPTGEYLLNWAKVCLDEAFEKTLARERLARIKAAKERHATKNINTADWQKLREARLPPVTRLPRENGTFTSNYREMHELTDQVWSRIFRKEEPPTWEDWRETFAEILDGTHQCELPPPTRSRLFRATPESQKEHGLRNRRLAPG